MPHKKLESRVLNARQTIIYNFSLNVQKHWYPSKLNGSFDGITKTSHASHKSKVIDYCIKLSTRIAFIICLPFFRLISSVYEHLTTAKNTRKYETVSKLTKINKSCKLGIMNSWRLMNIMNTYEWAENTNLILKRLIVRNTRFLHSFYCHFLTYSNLNLLY